MYLNSVWLLTAGERARTRTHAIGYGFQGYLFRTVRALVRNGRAEISIQTSAFFSPDS